MGVVEGLGGVRSVRGPLLLPCMCVLAASPLMCCLSLLTHSLSPSPSLPPARPLSLPVFLIFFFFAVRQNNTPTWREMCR